MRVLVVDDDAVNRKLLTGMLDRLGECETAESGMGAIEAFTSAWKDWRPFDVIFLDLMMPEMDGKEVVIKIREMEKERRPTKIKPAFRGDYCKKFVKCSEIKQFDCDGCTSFVGIFPNVDPEVTFRRIWG